jgi:hypothetical protein
VVMVIGDPVSVHVVVVSERPTKLAQKGLARILGRSLRMRRALSVSSAKFARAPLRKAANTVMEAKRDMM